MATENQYEQIPYVDKCSRNENLALRILVRPHLAMIDCRLRRFIRNPVDREELRPLVFQEIAVAWKSSGWAVQYPASFIRQVTDRRCGRRNRNLKVHRKFIQNAYAPFGSTYEVSHGVFDLLNANRLLSPLEQRAIAAFLKFGSMGAAAKAMEMPYNDYRKLLHGAFDKIRQSIIRDLD